LRPNPAVDLLLAGTAFMTMSDPAAATNRDTHRRAATTGLAVAGAGIIVFNIAPFLNWVDPSGDANPRTGYETDSLVPFIAYLGLGLLAAMAYAMKRAYRGQHRGLTLVSLAVGIAATLQCLAFAFNPMGGLERGDELQTQIGVYVGLLGAIIWAVGSFLLAKEIEGDDDLDDTTSYRAQATR
jgi:drug/metabolite transporter (DMT)-like permease